MVHITHVVFKTSNSRDDFSNSPGGDDTVYQALSIHEPSNETTCLSSLHKATKTRIPMRTVHGYKHRCIIKK